MTEQLTLADARPICAVSIDFKIRENCTLAEWVAEVATVAAAAWPLIERTVRS